MAGGTHAFDMIKRMKQNESLRKFRYFDQKQKYQSVENAIGIHYKEASALERECLRIEIRRRRSQEVRSVVVRFGVLGAAAFALITLLLKFI